MNFRYIKRGFLVITLSIFWGCASMPKPDGNIEELTKPIYKEYSESLKRGDIDAAIKSLKKTINVYTSEGKLAGGKGELFKYEAAYTALIAHLEFNRGRFPAAAKGWHESFEIEHSGLGYQNEVKQKNAKIKDGIATGLSAALAGAAAQKSGGGVYTYDVFNTVVPKPEMIIAGRPDASVARVPVRVELTPFDSIVKLNNNNKSYCTATMVSKRVAITAAHCMSQSGEAINPKLLSVRREGIFSSPAITVEKYYTHLGENKGWDTLRKNDWLILLMSTPYDKSGPFPRVYRDAPTPIISGTQNVMLAGYSSDLNKGFYLTLHYGCKFKPNNKSNDGVYLTNCENEKGSSGGAVMTTTPPYSIVAIHTAKLTSPSDEYSSVETFGPGFVATLNRLLPESQKIERLIPPPPLKIDYEKLKNGISAADGLEINRDRTTVKSNLKVTLANAELAIKNKNYSAAKSHYLNAAKLNSSQAHFKLGEIYMDGLGVKRDYKKAFMWFEVAIDTWDSQIKNQALQKSVKLASSLNSSDISEAKKMARSCVSSKFIICD